MRARFIGRFIGIFGCWAALGSGCDSTVLNALAPQIDASDASEAGANAKGLVAHWSFDDGSGPVVRDDSGNHHDGAMTGATWIADGRFGGALDFPAGGSVIVVPFPQPTASYTVSFWVRVAAADVADPVTVLSTEIYLQGGWEVNLHPNAADAAAPNVEFAYFVGSSSGNYAETQCNCVTAGAWTHIAAVLDAGASSLTLYRNGTATAPVTVTRSFTAGYPYLYIGRWDGTGRQLIGALDDIAIYDRALTAAEITRLDQASEQ
jgi:concanavalin A-like lectin/glucanase superfamily protein